MMRSAFLFAAAIAAVLYVSPTADAGSIDATDYSNGSSSFTTADGLVTLSATLGGAPASLGTDGGCCFGVDNNTIGDTDGSPATTADQEVFLIDLAANAAIESISVIFTRADGPGTPGDGIVISGFASDPGTSFFDSGDPVGTLNNLAQVNDLAFAGGTVSVDHSWRGGGVTVFAFSNPGASLGQTLSILAADPDETGPQIALFEINYAVVPEPMSGVCLAVGLGVFGCRRRRV